MSDRQPHLIYLDLNAYDKISIVCPGAEVGGCMVYWETTWDDPTKCRCVEDSCECRKGEHGDCLEFSFYITDIDHACRAKPDPDNCGVLHYVDAVGWGYIAAEDGWPTESYQEYPVKAGVEWDDGAASLVPWKEIR